MLHLQWLRGKHGGRRGVVLSWRRVTITPAPEPLPPDEATLVPVCYHCSRDAQLWCRMHQVAVCCECVDWHHKVNNTCLYQSISLPESILRVVVRQL